MSSLAPHACSLCHRVRGVHECDDGILRLHDGRRVSAATKAEQAEAIEEFAGPRSITVTQPDLHRGGRWS